MSSLSISSSGFALSFTHLLRNFPRKLKFLWIIQKSYETKQYKKGLKAADQILKKFPDHGGMKIFSFIYIYSALHTSSMAPWKYYCFKWISIFLDKYSLLCLQLCFILISRWIVRGNKISSSIINYIIVYMGWFLNIIGKIGIYIYIHTHTFLKFFGGKW